MSLVRDIVCDRELLHVEEGHSVADVARRMAEALLDSGANADTTDEYGETPVTLAAANADAALVQRLVTSGGPRRGVLGIRRKRAPGAPKIPKVQNEESLGCRKASGTRRASTSSYPRSLKRVLRDPWLVGVAVPPTREVAHARGVGLAGGHKAVLEVLNGATLKDGRTADSAENEGSRLGSGDTLNRHAVVDALEEKISREFAVRHERVAE